MGIFGGGAQIGLFPDQNTLKRGQKTPFLGSFLGHPPQNFGRGGMRKCKNAKNRGGKNEAFFRKMAFLAKKREI